MDTTPDGEFPNYYTTEEQAARRTAVAAETIARVQARIDAAREKLKLRDEALGRAMTRRADAEEALASLIQILNRLTGRVMQTPTAIE